MEVYFFTEFFETLFEKVSTFLTCVSCDTHASYIKTASGKLINKTENIFVISDAQVTAHFVFVDVCSTDNNDDFSLITELHKHTELAVRFKSRKNTGSVVIVKKLSAEFKIQFVVKFADAVANMLRLHLQILLVVKSCFHLSFSFPITFSRNIIFRPSR